jgi:hypothetical protein
MILYNNNDDDDRRTGEWFNCIYIILYIYVIQHNIYKRVQRIVIVKEGRNVNWKKIAVYAVVAAAVVVTIGLFWGPAWIM